MKWLNATTKGKRPILFQVYAWPLATRSLSMCSLWLTCMAKTTKIKVNLKKIERLKIKLNIENQTLRFFFFSRVNRNRVSHAS